jgi:hypothetical protein
MAGPVTMQAIPQICVVASRSTLWRTRCLPHRKGHPGDLFGFGVSSAGACECIPVWKSFGRSRVIFRVAASARAAPFALKS